MRILSLKEAATPAARQLRLEQIRAQRDRYEALFAQQVRAAGLPHSEAQYEFAKDHGRKYRFDRAWTEYRVLLEVQGGVFRKGGGAHSHPLNILRDIEKQSYAALCGYFVLPVTTDQVRKGEALQWIVRVLEGRGWKREAT